MIEKIKLTNFRLFDSVNYNTNNSLIIFSGKNATGKTSILEAIYLCATTKSHRSNDLKALIKSDKDFSISEITANKKYKVVVSKVGKSYFVNNQEIKQVKDFIGNLMVVMSSPDDLMIVKGTKADRRHFLDLNISMLDKNYLSASYAYKKLLKERNEALKQQKIDKTFLEIITNELISYLKVINKARNEFIDKLNINLKEIAEKLKIEEIKLNYLPTYDVDIKKSFIKYENQDINTKSTNIGTHRDDFEVLINNLDSSVYASEGQIKIICIAIKLALKKLITDITNREPILLLDDVFATLDKTRISSLTEYVINCKQAFITTTSILEIPDEILKNALVLRIENKEEK